MPSFCFKENVVDHCIYLKISGSKSIVLVLYADDILLASSNIGILHETTQMFKTFEMKDVSEASFVLDIEIHRDRSRGLLGWSEKAYINCVLRKFNIDGRLLGDATIVKGDKFSKSQYPQNGLEREVMK